ncbi:MAG TPA: kynureninase [Myxococcota bacterium]
MNEAQVSKARALDATDPLARFRQQFAFPQHHGQDACYLVGNSLGLMPQATRTNVMRELDAWSALGVEGHFARAGDAGVTAPPIEPWFSYHELFEKSGADLVGAEPGEVVAMGSLTQNLHLLMVSFYRPTPERNKIVVEKGPFPSDRYLVNSQARFHGYPDAMIELEPRAGEDLLRTDDILELIDQRGHEIALFLMGGVNFYSGQLFDIRAITRAAKSKGIVVGWDLAHAAGNVALSLHDDDVDFAAWCTYKYLNSGPGSVAMAFVHERHARAFDLPRFNGWWGNDPKTRFVMGKDFEPQPGAAGWQISNAPVLSMAALHASLTIFAEAGMPALAAKSYKATSFLLELLDELATNKPGALSVITPRDGQARGAQVSVRVHQDPSALSKRLLERGVFVDERKPDVIRVAPAPLYCSFADCVRFVTTLEETV